MNASTVSQDAGHPVASDFDRNVTRVLNTIQANKGLLVGEIILMSGIKKSTLMRRKAIGGWTAAEIDTLARCLGVHPGVFYEDADGIFRDGVKAAEGAMNPRSLGDSSAFTWSPPEIQPDLSLAS